MKKLIIDCSYISTTKLNTGIQRVVRKVLENIDEVTKDANYQPISVILENNYIKEVSFIKNRVEFKDKIDVSEGDVLLLLDSTWHLNTWGSIIEAKLKGAMIIAVVYDIIPISHSQFCDATLVDVFNKWFKIAIDYVDGFIAISKTVQDNLKSHLKEIYPNKIEKKKFDYFLLGADFEYKQFNLLSKNIRKNLIELYNNHKNIYLIVCTIEPRKNHKYLLDVFDKLWEQNIDVTLNIVGKEGWMVEELIERIHTHSHYNQKLFHWEDLNDEELNYCYTSSKMLLFPSIIEGFGLPIIESLNNKLPVLASNIPIHKEVGREYIGYFNIDNINDLIEQIVQIEKNGIPEKLQIKDNFRWLNWQESTQDLFKKIEKFNNNFTIDYKALKILETKRDTLLDKTSLITPSKQSLWKERIKKIPFIGWFSRWSYNLIRLNYIKHTLFIQQNRIESLVHQLNSQQKQIDTLLKDKSSINLDSYYLAFENIFRGRREDIKKRYLDYLKYIDDSIETALDIGCGRGEWVEILQENGIDSIGVDMNSAMLNEGISIGVKNLKKENIFEFLKSCKDNSFNLITAFHIIEHIPYNQLFVLLQEIKRVSTPNATILLETPNPNNLLVASYEFYKDPTHLNPLPSDVIKFMVEYIGFKEVRVEFLHPFPKTLHIQEDTQTALMLNDYLYKERDYLIIAKNIKESNSHG